MEPQTLDNPNRKSRSKKFAVFYSSVCIVLSAIYILVWLTQNLQIAPDVFALLFLTENAALKIAVGIVLGAMMGFKAGRRQKLQYCSEERSKLDDIFSLGASLLVALLLVATTRSIVFPLRRLEGEPWGTFIQWSFSLFASCIISFFWGAAFALLLTNCKRNEK